MKIKDKQALQQQTIDQLKTALKAAQLEVLKLKIERTTTGPKDVCQLRKIRQKIAIIKTFIREKELK